MKQLLDPEFELSSTQWILLLGLFALAFQPVLVGDLFGYLVYGDWMLETGNITRVDRYSFTAFGQPWTNHEWLFQVGLGLVFNYAGWSGLLILQAALVCVVLYFMAVFAGGSGTDVDLWLLHLTVPVFAVLPGLTLRPQLYTYLAILGMMILLAPNRSLRWYDFVVVPLIFVVWSNVHAGVLVGFAFLGFLLTGRFVLRPDRSRVANGLLLFGVCLAGTLVNPYGVELWWLILDTVSNPLTAVFIEEWQPTWEYPYHLTVWCLLGVLRLRYVQVVHPVREEWSPVVVSGPTGREVRGTSERCE